MKKLVQLTESLKRFGINEANVDIQSILKASGHNAEIEENSEFWGDDNDTLNDTEALIKKYLKKPSTNAKAVSSEDTTKVFDYIKSEGFKLDNSGVLSHPEMKPVSKEFLGYLTAYFVPQDNVLVVNDEGIVSIVG